MAVGFVVVYGKEMQKQKIVIPATHVPPFYFRVLIGGKHMHYEGVTGLFANIYYDVDAPAFIQNEE